MAEAGPSKISSGSLLDLKALTAEHKERFEKEGRSAVKGQARNKPISKVCNLLLELLLSAPSWYRVLTKSA